MTKVVINTCYGGFSLSDAAVELILQKRGVEYTKHRDPIGYCNNYATATGQVNCQSFEGDRTDPDVVAVVEELGSAANRRYSNLQIEELTPGEKYRIREYDGMEWIERESEIKWSIA